MGLVEKTFSQGEVIIKEGDIGKSFFQIVKGKAGVYADYGKADPFRIAVLEAGEFFGEMAIIEEYPRSATVVAIGTVTVIEITEEDLNAFFSENPEQIIELMTHIGKRVQSMTKDYDDAKALLKQLNGAEESKKKSLFSKIKKHIDAYQVNKNQLTDVKADPYGEKFESLKSDRTGKTETFTAGKIFFKEGESEFRKCMYILKSGSVGLYKNYRKSDEEKTSEMNALSVFGEIGMITFTPRSYTAVTESDETVVEIIYREDLEDIFRENPLKIELILRHLSNRLRCITIDFLKVCKEITENHGN
jgi:CRP-like cAMP-binding protein